MTWTCSCGNVNSGAFCARCGSMQQGTRRSPHKLGWALTAGVLLFVALGIVLGSKRPKVQSTQATPPPPVAASSPTQAEPDADIANLPGNGNGIEYHLIELGKKRDTINLLLSLAIEEYKKTLRQGDDDAYLDALDKKIADLVKQKKALDEEIAEHEAPSSTPAEDPPKEVKPSAPPSPEVQQLIEKRKEGVAYVQLLTSYLNAPSFSERAELYCRYQTEKFMGGNPEEKYAQLMRSKPATREEEMERQYALQAGSQVVAKYEENMNVCRGSATSGLQPLPSIQDTNSKIDEARKTIIKIDQLLAASNSDKR
jgi:hypothetical protein